MPGTSADNSPRRFRIEQLQGVSARATRQPKFIRLRQALHLEEGITPTTPRCIRKSNQRHAPEMFLVTPEQIGAVMALEPTPRSFAELDEQVARGLPSAALKALIERISLRPDEHHGLLHRIVPKSTLMRRRPAHLSSGESEKTERLARAFAAALHVWASDEEARAFMHAPHPMLRDRAPIDVALTELGARRVEELLWRLFYGVSA